MGRVFAVIGALTFFQSGCSVLSDDRCPYVVLGGGYRRLMGRCTYDASEGISQGGAGALFISVGFGLLLLAFWPYVMDAYRTQRFESFRPTQSRRSQMRSSVDSFVLNVDHDPVTTTREPLGSICKDCGGDFVVGSKFCGHCGAPRR